MDSKKKPDDSLDVSSILENYEEKPIVAKEEKPLVKKEVADKSFESAQGRPVEERLREDLKMSYPAKGILDITFGGYGFLRQDYILNPDRDIYVSTSQIRRFWLRRGDE